MARAEKLDRLHRNSMEQRQKDVRLSFQRARHGPQAPPQGLELAADLDAADVAAQDVGQRMHDLGAGLAHGAAGGIG